MNSEYFRHLRPTSFNTANSSIENLPYGGVSFLLRGKDFKTFDIWVYMTPATVRFSAKQAVASLRRAADSGVSPFSTITMGIGDVTSQLLDHFESESESPILPSDVYNFLKDIRMSKNVAMSLANRSKLNMSGSIDIYSSK